MRFSRSFRAALVVLFLAVLGGFGPAIDGVASLSSFQAPPSLEAWLDSATQTFRLEAHDGLPGAAGSFNFLVVSGPTQGLFSVPFTFDSSGEASMALPFSDLNGGVPLAVAIQMVGVGNDGVVYVSGLWALGSHYYLVTDPLVWPCDNCPTAPGAWVEYVPWPGTNGDPIYPHWTVAIPSSELRAGGQPMLALESGPAGSFPIN